jgi:hypothetical protein
MTSYYDKEEISLNTSLTVYWCYSYGPKGEYFLVEAVDQETARAQATVVLGKDVDYCMGLISTTGTLPFYHQRGGNMGLWLESLSGNRLVNLRAVKEILACTMAQARDLLTQRLPIFLREGKQGELDNLVKQHNYTHLKVKRQK